ncbi:MAG: substrate-binding domain-containing protein [Eubacteriales bacterium]|nr:substrate-binding domain-containing protein [Eubacteriales bacterium]
MRKIITALFAVVLFAGLTIGMHSYQEKPAQAMEKTEDQTADAAGDAAEQNATLETTETGIDMSMKLEPGSRVAVVSKKVNGDFWELIKKGMEQALSDVNDAYGYEKDDKITMTFEGASDELDVETQINTLDAVISENPAVLCLSASDMDSCQAQMEAARENGIPVAIFDSNVVNTDLVGAYRASDNRKIGQIAAEKMVEVLPDGGKIAVFGIQEKTQTAKDRVESFVETISEYDGYEIVEVIYEDQVEDFKGAIQGTLEENPDLSGVFCENADSTSAYLEVTQKSENSLPIMIGVDGTKQQIEAIKEGKEYGSVSQNPYAIGYQTMLAALAMASETECNVEQTVLLEPKWLDAGNVENPDSAAYIYN